MVETLFVAADALTDEDVGIVPLSGWAWGPSLNAGMTISGTISPKTVSRDLVEPGERVLYVYRDGRLWGGCIIVELQPKGQEVGIVTQGFEAYPHRVDLTQRLDPAVYQDPLVLSRQLWTWMQARPDANLRVAMDTATTKGKVKIGTPADPFLMDWWDGRTVGSYIDALAQADDGFDYRIDVTQARDGTRTKRLVHGYPRLGQRRDDVEFNTTTNVTVLPDETIGWAPTDVQVLGAGEGRNMPMALFGVRKTGRLHHGVSVQMKAEKNQDRLNARARAELTARTYSRDVQSIELRDHPSAALGSFVPGDDVYARLHSGWTDFDAWVRVMGYQVSDQGGQERITVDVARSQLFVYGPDPNIDVSSDGGE